MPTTLYMHWALVSLLQMIILWLTAILNCTFKIANLLMKSLTLIDLFAYHIFCLNFKVR